MIKISNLSKSYEVGKVLSHVNLVVNEGEKVGLVGPNGVGKSTLLKLVAGKERSDEGSIQLENNDKVGYLAQEVDLASSSQTVRDFLVLPFAELMGLEERMNVLTGEISEAAGEKQQKLLEEYGDLQEKFINGGGYEIETRLKQIAEGLSLKPLMDLKMSSLSGGQKARVAIGQMLMENPTILLLDEPTNHLDLPSLLWLESYIMKDSRPLIVVSHDRRFLDKTVSRIVEVDPFSHEITAFGGNYSVYLEEKKRLRERQLQNYEQQQKRFDKLDEDIKKTKNQALRTETSTKNDVLRRYAKKVAKKAKSRENRLQKMKESEEAIVKPREKEKPKLKLKTSGKGGNLLVKLSGISMAFGKKELLRDVEISIRSGDHIAILGSNGSGKSTLLKILLEEIKPNAGTVEKGQNVKIGYLPQEYGHLPKEKKALEWFRSQVAMHEDEARSLLGSLSFSQDVLFSPISKLSRGEVARLLLAVLVAGDYDLILLDEPTNHLDLDSLSAMEEALTSYQGSVVLVTHDRYFLDKVGIDEVLALEDCQLKKFSSWKAYENEVEKTR